ncbi:MAG: N-6 DNA methylase, partial [Elusimicrobia bacterium]|nr:N-6 DNA methylase [Elusimicrobiota bacterium]
MPQAELPPPSRTAKALGAFYTDSEIAEFLAGWAIRSPRDLVIDPSFGGGVFLRSASKRLEKLHGNPGKQVFGVEIDHDVHSKILPMLRDEFSVAES